MEQLKTLAAGVADGSAKTTLKEKAEKAKAKLKGKATTKKVGASKTNVGALKKKAEEK